MRGRRLVEDESVLCFQSDGESISWRTRLFVFQLEMGGQMTDKGQCHESTSGIPRSLFRLKALSCLEVLEWVYHRPWVESYFQVTTNVTCFVGWRCDSTLSLKLLGIQDLSSRFATSFSIQAGEIRQTLLLRA